MRVSAVILDIIPKSRNLRKSLITPNEGREEGGWGYDSIHSSIPQVRCLCCCGYIELKHYVREDYPAICFQRSSLQTLTIFFDKFKVAFSMQQFNETITVDLFVIKN